MLESVSLDVVVCIVAPALLIIIIAATVPGLGFRPCYTIERNFEIDTPSGIRVFGILLTLHGVAEKSPTVFVATRINAAPGDSRVVDFEMTGMKLSTKRTITFHGKSTPYQTEINAFKVDCDVILPDEESSIIPLQLELTEQGSINVKWNNENLPRSLTGR